MEAKNHNITWLQSANQTEIMPRYQSLDSRERGKRRLRLPSSATWRKVLSWRRSVQTSSGKIVQGLKSTYKRHGTVNLFAALEVANGVIRGNTTQTKKRIDFQTFMSEIIEDQPS